MFYDLSKDATAKEIETLSYLFGNKKQVDGVSHIYITHLFLSDQTATANSSQVTNKNCLDDFKKQYNVTEYGWMHSHPLETCCMSSIDTHIQAIKQKVDSNYLCIVFSPIDNAFGFTSMRAHLPNGQLNQEFLLTFVLTLHFLFIALYFCFIQCVLFLFN